MKTQLPPLAGLLACFLFQYSGQAGSPDTGNVVLTPTPKPVPAWEIKVGAPLWASAVTGTMGVHGISTHVSVGPIPIVRHSNFIAALGGEVRRGRFGVMGDLLYINAQAGQSGSGLVNKVDLGFQQFLGELFVYYRLLESPRCSLDLLAGFRYTYSGDQVGLQANDQNINTASTNLVNNVATAVVTPGSNLNTLVKQAITDKLTVLAGRDPKLPVPPLAGLEPGVIRDAVLAIIESQQGALRDAIRSGVQSRVNQLKAQLVSEINARVTTQLNRSFSLYEGWVDPTFGVRGRYNFTKALYLTGETDVGGFGIGSDVAWQGVAAFGIQLTRNIYTEIGYRFYYDDYRDTNYLYQVTLHGAQVTLGVNF